MLRDMLLEILGRHRQEARSVSGYRRAETAAREERELQILHRHGIGFVAVHLDLFEDDLLFSPEFSGGNRCVQIHVGEDVYRFGEMLVGNVGEVGRRLFARPGVEVASAPLYRLRNLQLGTLRRPFEKHVLDEMGNACAIRGLMPGA